MTPRATCFIALLAFAAVAIAADPKPLKIEDAQTMSATVVAVDLGQRMLTLRDAEGRTERLQVSSEVRNLPQVTVGDRLVVRYHQSLDAELKPKGTSRTLGTVDEAADIARAAPGSKPGGAVANTVTTTVVVRSVDSRNHSITVTDANGLVQSIPLVRPEARAFAANLKRGDEVELTYTVAVAVNIEAVE